MRLTSDEVKRAADVFPLLYADIRACHSVLFGADAFKDLVIVDEHRRLRIEQELREARIELRRIVATEGLSGPTLAAPLARTIKKLRGPLSALLALKGKEVDDDLASVLRGATSVWREDTTVLLSPQHDPNAALRVLRKIVDAAIEDVDSLTV